MPPVVYSGSLERIDFGEEGDTKGFCWVELERGETKWHFETVKARNFVTLKADLRESTDPTQEVVTLIGKHKLTEAVVRVLLDLTPETEANLNDGVIRDVLRQSGAHFVAAVRKEIAQTTRARLGGSPEGLTDDQLLDRYLISRQVDDARRDELLKAAQEIFETTVIRRSE